MGVSVCPTHGSLMPALAVRHNISAVARLNTASPFPHSLRAGCLATEDGGAVHVPAYLTAHHLPDQSLSGQARAITAVIEQLHTVKF